ncbi:MAG TPA: site-specific integrase [Acidimicrobiales bacterium]|nr:site-specific integrase [Acidimicrobiales bacterium]
MPGEWRLVVNLPPGPDGKRREYFELYKGAKTAAGTRLAELVADRANLIPARERRQLSAAVEGWVDAGRPIERPTYDTDPAKVALWRQAAEPGPRSRTVKELMDAYADHIENRGRSRLYVSQVRRKVKARVLPELGQVQLDRLNARTLDSFYTKLLAEGLAPATVRQLHSFLSAALNLAVKWDWIDRAPTEKTTPPTVRAPVLPVPTPQHVQQLLERADGILRRAILLAALTGARRGELCALRWSDVDRETGTLTIARAISDGREGPTKTHQKRTMAIDPEFLGEPGPPDAYLLTGTDQPASPNVLTQKFRDLVDELELPHYRFHDLRHYTATTMIADGVDARTVAARQGWSSMQMLDRYTSPISQRDREAAGVLARSLTE